VAFVILQLCEVPGLIQYLNQPGTSDPSSAVNVQIYLDTNAVCLE
jgi:hypothetical protein